MFRSLARLSWLLLLGAGCARVQRVALQHDVVRLPDGRFSGPFEIPVPRRADHDGHDFEIRVVLRARCAPKLTLAFPDGETRVLGVSDARWQELLARRAKSQPAAAVVIAPPSAPAPALSEPPPSAPPPRPGALASIDAEVTIPLPARRTGHWESTPTETWPGQLDFERARFERCAGVDESSARYLKRLRRVGHARAVGRGPAGAARRRARVPDRRARPSEEGAASARRARRLGPPARAPTWCRPESVPEAETSASARGDHRSLRPSARGGRTRCVRRSPPTRVSRRPPRPRSRGPGPCGAPG